MLSGSSLNLNFSDFSQEEPRGAAMAKQESYVTAATMYKINPRYLPGAAIKAKKESLTGCLQAVHKKIYKGNVIAAVRKCLNCSSFPVMGNFELDFESIHK